MSGHSPTGDAGAVARALVAAVTAGDYKTAITYCSPDLLFRIVDLEMLHGHEGLRALMEFNADVASDARVEFHHVLASGEIAAINRTNSFVVGGQPLVLEIGSFFTVRHGLVVEWTEFLDLQDFERALGH